MAFEFFSALDTGRARNNNEDSVAVDAANAVAVLADGMGGYNAGEVASEMAAAFVTRELGRWIEDAGAQVQDHDIVRAMEICVDNANRAIFNAAHASPTFAGMGTTIVVLVMRETAALVGHVGDSRAYRLRAGQLEQITRDHSLLQEQLDAGLITPEQAQVSSNRNLVTRAVGVEDTVLLDTRVHEALPGDTLLLCSDGLTDMLDDRAIERILGGAASLPQAAQMLIDAANEAGGRDNISVILARQQGMDVAPSGRAWWPFRRA